MQPLRSLVRYGVVLAIATLGISLTTASAQAANEIVFRYGIWRQRLSVIELTNFAQTGEQSPVLRRYLERTNSKPEEVRRILNQPVDVNQRLLDKGLDNPASNMLLDELGKIIQMPDDEGNQEALRESLLTSAKDNQITVLEVIQNYPSDEIHLDVKRAIRTYERVSKYQQPIQDALQRVGPLRQVLKDQGINLPDFLK